MIYELIENDTNHRDLTLKLDWYFLPIHNPDGYAYSHASDRLWRKTRYLYHTDRSKLQLSQLENTPPPTVIENVKF